MHSLRTFIIVAIAIWLAASFLIMVVGIIMCIIESIKGKTITDKFLEDLEDEQREDEQ